MSCIEDQFQAKNSTQIASGKKPKIPPRRLPIRGSTDNFHDHIAFTVRSHTSYLLLDDVLSFNYYKEECSDDKEIPCKKYNWLLSWLLSKLSR